MAILRSGHDARAGFTMDGVFEQVRLGDDDLLAAVVKVIDRGLDLRAHAARPGIGPPAGIAWPRLTVMRSRKRWLGLPKSSATLSTPVEMTKRSAFRCRASRLDAASLSITAAQPCRSPFGRRTTGMPPPPTAITTMSLSQQRPDHVFSSTISRGGGRAPRGASRGRHPQHRPAVLLLVMQGVLVREERADRLGRVPKRRIVRVHHHLGHDGHDGLLQALPPQFVLERLLDLVADRALGVRYAALQGNLVQLGLRDLRAHAG